MSDRKDEYLDYEGLSELLELLKTKLDNRFKEVSDTASGSRIMTILKDEGIAFGGMAEKGKFKIYDNLEFNGCIFPIGFIYMSMVDENPAKWFGGTWEKIEERFLLAASSAYPVGSTGGEVTHTLTKEELPNITGEVWNVAVQDTNVDLSTGGVFSKRAANEYHSFGQGGANNGYDGFTMNFGSNQPHNNMPPYLAVYMWKRTA